MSEKLSDIYVRFQKPLLRFLRYKTNDEHLAQDLLHEVFIKAANSLESLKETEKIQSWLYKIATNTFYDYLRKNKLPLTDESEMEEDNLLYESVMNELVCCLNDFIMTLPTAQRDVVQSTYFDELTLDEFAQKSKTNLSTVKSHSKRAKKRLKQLFEECCDFQINHRGEMIDFNSKNEAKCNKLTCGT